MVGLLFFECRGNSRVVSKGTNSQIMRAVCMLLVNQVHNLVFNEDVYFLVEYIHQLGHFLHFIVLLLQVGHRQFHILVLLLHYLDFIH